MQVASENLIAWGDCDSAGIVYYPKYFYFIDVAFQTLLRRAGLNHRILIEQYGVRVPIVDAGARFFAPATFDDRLVVSADIAHWGTKSFRMQYKGTREGVSLFEGHEVRVWAAIAGDGSITTAAIPLEFKAALSAAAHGQS